MTTPRRSTRGAGVLHNASVNLQRHLGARLAWTLLLASAGCSGSGGAQAPAEDATASDGSDTGSTGDAADSTLTDAADSMADALGDGAVDTTGASSEAGGDAAGDGAADGKGDTKEVGGFTTELCNGVDDDGDLLVDEGCDDDADGYCDGALGYAPGAACSAGDCDDTKRDVHPGSTVFQEGVDYDCDGAKKYKATIIVTVDDVITQLCANGVDLALGPNASAWTSADTHTVIMRSGTNVVGISGKDTGLAITAMAAVVTVNGTTYKTTGVAGGKVYAPSDPEWSATPWRYYDKFAADPQSTWCDVGFDDSTWGPAMNASNSGSAPFEVGLASPWGCGTSLCTDFPADKRPNWIWDPFPTSLQSAWIRIKIALP